MRGERLTSEQVKWLGSVHMCQAGGTSPSALPIFRGNVQVHATSSDDASSSSKMQRSAPLFKAFLVNKNEPQGVHSMATAPTLLVHLHTHPPRECATHIHTQAQDTCTLGNMNSHVSAQANRACQTGSLSWRETRCAPCPCRPCPFPCRPCRTRPCRRPWGSCPPCRRRPCRTAQIQLPCLLQ